MSTKDMIEWARVGKEFNEEFYKSICDQGIEPRPITKDELMQMGAKLWSFSYALEPNDDVLAFEHLMQELIKRDEKEMCLAAGAPDMQILLSWVTRWADQGFPHLIVGQKTIAALMATSAHEEIIEHIHAPWKAFLIDIPKGLIETKDHVKNKYAAMTSLAVHEFKRGNEVFWNWRLTSNESTIQLWRFGVSSKELIKSDIGFEESEMKEMYAATIEEEDGRVAQLIGRLIIGVCLTFPGNNKKIGSSHKINGRWEIKDGQNICHLRNYELRPAISIDCRDVITDYVHHGLTKNRNAPTVRSLVRGHFRRPPHGIEKGAEKTVWVQPHWKNLDSITIVVRSHKEKNDQ